MMKKPPGDLNYPKFLSFFFKLYFYKRNSDFINATPILQKKL